MTSSQNTVETAMGAIRGSLMVRLFVVGFLALVLLIPIVMIGGLVGERHVRRDTAVTEVSEKWGRAQAIAGPALVVPYKHHWEDSDPNGRRVSHSEARHAVMLPDRLHVRGRLEAEVRSRGIFSIPVYRADLTLQGEFTRPRFEDLGIDPATMEWSRAQLVVGISDARAIKNLAAVTWNGRQTSFLPGVGEFTALQTGIHAPVDVAGPADRYEFTLPLALNGSIGLSLVPFGARTLVEFSSNSENPSFQGAWLPERREVSSTGFSATWEISFLGRNYPQSWSSRDDMKAPIVASQFGVDLVTPVDQYRMAERSVKFAALFILLTFAAVWLIEVLAGVNVHPIQYLLLGSALCVFYLLELSLAEHVGFPVAYTIAAVAVVLMVGSYSLVVLGRRWWAFGIALGVALLYGYLYVLLMNEDYALLIGSLGLFMILAGVMFVTRKVDWYTIGNRSLSRSNPK